MASDVTNSIQVPDESITETIPIDNSNFPALDDSVEVDTSENVHDNSTHVKNLVDIEFSDTFVSNARSSPGILDNAPEHSEHSSISGLFDYQSSSTNKSDVHNPIPIIDSCDFKPIAEDFDESNNNTNFASDSISCAYTPHNSRTSQLNILPIDPQFRTDPQYGSTFLNTFKWPLAKSPIQFDSTALNSFSTFMILLIWSYLKLFDHSSGIAHLLFRKNSIEDPVNDFRLRMPEWNPP